MDAEFEAWWGLVLACWVDRKRRLIARQLQSRSRRTEVAGLVPWIDVISQSIAGKCNLRLQAEASH